MASAARIGSFGDDLLSAPRVRAAWVSSFPSALFQPHARTPAVLGDELDAGGFEGASHRFDVVDVAARQPFARFHSAKRWD